MPGGGGGNTTQVTQAEPWKGARPFLQGIYGQGQQLFHNQPLTPYHGLGPDQRLQQASAALGGSPQQMALSYGLPADMLGGALTTGIAPLSQAQQGAHQGMLGLAGSPLSGLYGQAQGALGGMLQNPLGMGGGQAGDYWSSVLSGQAGPTQMLQETAGGGFLGANPHLEGVYQDIADRATRDFATGAMPTISAHFSGAGRYGSGAHAAATGRAAEGLGRGLAGTASQLFGSAYESERDRMEGARGALAGQHGQAASGLLGLGQAGAGNLFQAMGMAPGMAEAPFQAHLQRLGLAEGVGGQQRDLAQQLAEQAMGGYGQVQAAPWDQLSQYAALVSGLPSSSMQGTSMTSPYFRNPIAGGAGGALSGAMLASMIPGVGPGVAALTGGGLGLLSGFF